MTADLDKPQITLKEAWKDLALGTRVWSVSHSTKRMYLFIGWGGHYAYFCEVMNTDFVDVQPMIYRVSTVATARKVFPSLF